MTKTSLLLAFAVAAFAGAAHAQAVSWDSPNLAAACVGEMITDQAAPATPLAAPAVSAGQASRQEHEASCADASELDGRILRITLDIQGEDKPLVLDYKFAGCVVEYPRDEPPAPAYTRRSYKTAKGDELGVYSGAKDTSTLSIYLANGTSSATPINVVSNADLLSGRTLDLGDYLMLKHNNRRDGQGFVLRTKGTITAVPAK